MHEEGHGGVLRSAYRRHPRLPHGLSPFPRGRAGSLSFGNHERHG
jgi:hypothetical protein